MVMSDSDYQALKISAAITPEESRWPTGYDHWGKLRGVVAEARERATKVFAAMDKVGQDAFLSKEGQQVTRARLADKAINEAKESMALQEARDAVKALQDRWAAKLDDLVKPATDVHTAAVYTAIWNRVAGMTKEERMNFVAKNADDPVISSALLSAPPAVSNLTDVEVALVKSKAERNVLSPEIIQAREDVAKALGAAERGWNRHLEIIAQRGGGNADKGRKAA